MRNVLFGVALLMSSMTFAVDMKMNCSNPGAWKIEMSKIEENDIEEHEIRLSSPVPATPPRFNVTFDVPQLDAHHRWTSDLEKVVMPPDWRCTTSSRLCQSLPLWSYVNDLDENRILVAVDEAKRMVRVSTGLREEGCRIVWKLEFFTEPEAPVSEYSVRVRIDRRNMFFGDAIREGTAWIEHSANIKPVVPPADAFEPLYSSWYQFHQNVFDREIEAECEVAAKLGMKVIIVDDGWQTDDTNRGYRYCGDWNVSPRRFVDMRAHVDRVHALGMKYMMWYSVPFVGVNSSNYKRFKGKYLCEMDGVARLDPRFPEVREFLVGVYEKALKDWNLDGFKLDFIDSFSFNGPDPAIKDNFAGRDIKALPEAVDTLMKEIYSRLSDIRPNILIEFRQSYIGPAIRQYGNMMRAADCPGDLLANRARTANLRLTSGRSSVHADMLEWHEQDTAENAARFILSTMFSTIQYSMMLRTLPESHKRMITHWLKFSQRHRNALLKGEFRPHHFEAFYPWIEAWDDKERIVGVYTEGTVVPVDSRTKTNIVLNGTGSGSVVLDSADDAEVTLFDTYGDECGTVRILRGLNRVTVPVSGYLSVAISR